jgi:hypothetical protein
LGYRHKRTVPARSALRYEVLAQVYQDLEHLVGQGERSKQLAKLLGSSRPNSLP